METSEEIIVTGTNIRSADPLSPVISITRETIEKAGFGTVYDYLQTLPQNFAGAAPQNTGFSARSSVGNANGSAASGVDLRGLGPQATLVLVNGQRSASALGGGAFDISLVPAGLVDRVEILTDGASAIYGSDAVASVVNLITRQDFTGFETTVRGEMESRTGESGYNLTQLAGFGWDSGNLALSYNYRDAVSIEAADRDFAVNRPRSTLLPTTQQGSGYLSLQQKFSPAAILTSDLLYARRRSSEFSGFFNQYREAENVKFGGASTLDCDLTPEWRLSLTAAYSRDRLDSNGIIGAVTFGSLRTLRFTQARPVVEGRLFDLPAGPLRLAAGIDFQRQTLLAMTRGASATTQKQEIRAGFAELLIPLVGGSNARPGLQRLSVSLAGRYDDYSDFGSTNNPKIALSWKPAADWEMHASYSSSFRAPLFDQTRLTGTQFASMANVPDPLSATGTSPAIFRFGGNPDLSPETAQSLVVGLKHRPASSGLQLSLDYFQVDYQDRIINLINEAGTGFLQQGRFADFVVRNPSAAQIAEFLSVPGIQVSNSTGQPLTAAVALADLGFKNAGNTRIAGLDVSPAVTFDTGAGSLNLRAAVTYFLHYRQRLGSAGAMIDLLDRKFFPVDFKGYLTADCRSGPWVLHVQGNYTDRYKNTTDSACAAVACPIASWFTADLAASYSFDKDGDHPLQGLDITVSAQNLFDEDPPRVNDTFGVGYDPSHANPLGRLIGVSLGKRW